MKAGASEGGAARGLFWPMVIVAGGLAAYYLLFEFLVDPLTHPFAAMSGFDYRFLWEPPDPAPRAAILAADLNARYALAVPSVLLALTSLGAMVGAFVVVLPVFGRWAMATGAVGALAGAALGFFEQYSNPVRIAAADCPPGSGFDFCPLDQAVARSLDGWPIDLAALEQIRLIVNLNSALSVASVCVVGVCFLFIARGAREHELTAPFLLLRRRALSAAMAISAAILVFSVATTHGFYHLASALMPPDVGEPVAALGSAGSTYWGAVYTTILIVIALPAALSLMGDTQQAARRALPDSTFAERKAWREHNGLVLRVGERLGGAIAAFAPVLTSPALDLVRNTVEAI